LNTTVLEKTDYGEVPIDIFSKLSSNRILFLSSYIDSNLATDISAALIYLDSMYDSVDDPKISIYINSDGADTRSTFMLYDVMKTLRSPIETFCTGHSCELSTLILSSGTKGMRYATKNAVIMLSQLRHDDAFITTMTDSKKIMELFKKDNDSYIRAISKNVNKNMSVVRKKCLTNNYLESKDALSYGLIDQII